MLAGRYRVVRPVARGGMGEVYEVEDTQLHVTVALKVLDPTLGADAKAQRDFQAEVKNSRSVSHPNVCRIFDFGQHEEGGVTTRFLTMEFLRGEPLDARLRRGLPPLDEVRAVMRQVAAGVDAAHAVGVVHRDLKPGNVLLVAQPDGSTRAVVADFGIARRLDQTAAPGEGWAGTPGYVAPEQLAGEPVGTAADLYAFGTMLFELATGRLPFMGATAAEMVLPRLTLAAPRARSVRPELPERWDEAIARCLEREPGRRFGRATEAMDALDAPLAPAPALPAPVRHSWIRPGAAVGVLAMALAGLWAWWHRSPLPAHDRQVHVRVERAPSAAALPLPAGLPAFEDAAAWVVQREWRRLEKARRFRVGGEGPGNVTALLRWHPAAAGVAGELELWAGERLVEHTAAQAASVVELAQGLYPALAGWVGEGQPARELWPEEEVEAKRIGAPSPEAYRTLESLYEAYWASQMVDAAPVARDMDRLLLDHPGWPHAIALKLVTLGIASSEAKALAQAHLGALVPGVDSLAERLVRAVASGAVRPPLGELLTDRMLQAFCVGINSGDNAADDLAIFRAVALSNPDLQFGSDVVNRFRQGGLAAQADAFLQDWLKAAPGQPDAWISATAHLDRGAPAPLRQVAQAFFLLHGRQPISVLTLAAAHLSRSELEESQALALQALPTPPQFRASAQLLLGQAAAMQGHFEQARGELERAWHTADGVGVDFYWTQDARELVQVLERLGRDDEAATWRQKQIEAYERFVWPAPHVAALRYLQAQHAQHGCPAVDVFVAPTLAGADRADAERMVLRAAARQGCAPCKAVVASGPSPDETMLSLTHVLARCALEEGQGVDQALALEQAGTLLGQVMVTAMRDPSMGDVVLARYWVGKLLEKKGDAAGARAAYEGFLTLWGHPDRPVPEVDDARARLAALAR